MMDTAFEVRKRLKEKGHSVSLVNVRFVKPCDEAMLHEIAESHDIVITMEENVLIGGYGLLAMRLLNDMKPGIRVINIAIPNMFIEQGTQAEQRKESGLDADSIMKKLESELEDI